MKTRIYTKDIYTFDELSESAKENVFEYFRQEPLYGWEQENEDTLSKFESIFPITVTNWEYGYHNYINYRIDYLDYNEIFEFTGIRLMKYIINNYWNLIFKRKFVGHLKGKEKFTPVYSKCQWNNDCVLTGYAMDNSILQPIYDFLKKPDNRTLEDLLYECLQSWIYACRDDYDYIFTEEYIKEIIEINNYEFDKEGNLI